MAHSIENCKKKNLLEDVEGPAVVPVVVEAGGVGGRGGSDRDWADV